MKRTHFIALFFGAQICMIFLYVHVQSRLIQCSYEKQRLETEQADLIQKKKTITNELYLLQNRDLIKEHAQKNGMQPITLKQVTTL